MKTTLNCVFTFLMLLMTLMIIQPAWSSIEDVGVATTLTGTVYECDVRGSGIQIDMDGQIVSIFGKGPAWYWQEQGVDFPEVGETVTITAYEITFSDGTTKLVAKSIDIGDDGSIHIDLRDDDGTPLWRQQGKRISQSQARKGSRWAE